MNSNRESAQNIWINTSKNGECKPFRILALVPFKKNGSEICFCGFRRARKPVLCMKIRVYRTGMLVPLETASALRSLVWTWVIGKADKIVSLWSGLCFVLFFLKMCVCVCVCVWTIFKVFTEFATILFPFMFCYFGHKACGILAPGSEMEPMSVALGGKGLTTGPTRKSFWSGLQFADKNLVFSRLPGPIAL